MIFVEMIVGEVIVDAVEGSCSHDAWIYLTCRIFDY